MVHGLTDWIPNTYLSPFNSVDIRPEMLGSANFADHFSDP